MATALADEGLSRFSIKCALNHTDRSVTGIYDRSEHLIRKRAALAAWNSLLGANQSTNRNQSLLWCGSKVQTFIIKEQIMTKLELQANL